MPLTITLERYPEQLAEWETHKTLMTGRLSIGRSSHYDWVLQDPEKHLSRLQCVIVYKDGSYYITDESTNGVFLNHSEERLQRGQPKLIQDRDHLSMGDYEMGISLHSEAELSGGPQAETLIGVLPTDIMGADPNAGLSSLATSPEPGTNGIPSADFDILGGGAGGGLTSPTTDTDDPLLPPVTAPDPLGLGVVAGAYNSEKATESDHLPPEEEFFRSPDPVMPETVAETSTPPEPPLVEPEEPAVPSPSLGGIPDNWWESGSPAEEESSVENVPAPHQEPPIPPQKSPIPPQEIELPPATVNPEFEDKPSSQAPTIISPDFPDPIRPSASPPSTQAYAPLPTAKKTPPSVIPPTTKVSQPAELPTTPPVVTTTPTSGVGGMDGALQAFLEGAGMTDLVIEQDKVTEVMLTMGKTFRETVTGMMAVLVARSGVKSELQVDRTMIQPLGNNPLKAPAGCAPLSVEETMKLMLLRNIMGFMSAEKAVEEGFKDIQVHEMAVLAGLQAALKGTLERFQPEQLEARLSRHSILDNILPSSRKAKYWDTFCQFYAELAHEAEDDFNEMFRDCFAKAYEEESHRFESM